MWPALVCLLCYLGAGVGTNLLLFHYTVVVRGLDAANERVRIARTVPPLARFVTMNEEDLAERAVAVGTVFLWPLFLVPLLRWMSQLGR